MSRALARQGLVSHSKPAYDLELVLYELTELSPFGAVLRRRCELRELVLQTIQVTHFRVVLQRRQLGVLARDGIKKTIRQVSSDISRTVSVRRQMSQQLCKRSTIFCRNVMLWRTNESGSRRHKPIDV